VPAPTCRRPHNASLSPQPTTNPGATAIFKSLVALKTRNAVVFSPHPRAVKSTVEAARIVRDAAEKAGAPKGLIGWLEHPTLQLSQALMQVRLHGDAGALHLRSLPLPLPLPLRRAST
jgi:acetaldehyde dehydrogenase/alcohol dehydrogenase